MFVFPKESLPKDPVFPADMEKLGYVCYSESAIFRPSLTKSNCGVLQHTRYFVNEKDQIKMISNPEENFLYKINANERYNEMQKEAMNSP